MFLTGGNRPHNACLASWGLKKKELEGETGAT